MTTITYQIDGLIFDLPLDVKIKIWELIELYVKEEITIKSGECLINDNGGNSCLLNPPLNKIYYHG